MHAHLFETKNSKLKIDFFCRVKTSRDGAELTDKGQVFTTFTLNINKYQYKVYIYILTLR